MLRQLAATQGVSTSEALRTIIRDTFTRRKLTLKGKASKRASKKAPAKATGRSVAKKPRKKVGRK